MARDRSDEISPAASLFRIGHSPRRVEDLRFLRGAGRYVDDIECPNAAHLIVVRSPHAAAAIRAIDTRAAKDAPGVLVVLTAADIADVGLLRTVVTRTRPDGSPMVAPPYPMLAQGEARFVGDAVAAVIAETLQAARDAADRIEIDYDPHAAVTDIVRAVEPGACAVWPDGTPDNRAFLFEAGDRVAVDAAFRAADHVVSLDFRITRVSANPMEPRAALALYDPIEDRYTLHAGTQMPHAMRNEIAEHALFIPANRLRVVSPDVGGAFGMKECPYQEYVLALVTARRLGRPVRWTATRTESFLSDCHARDNESTVELALSSDGTFRALRVRTAANLGAYINFQGPASSTNNVGGLAGVYRTPHIFTEVTGVLTHTQPLTPYRGAGRPEAIYAVERIIDVAADTLGFDRIALRRQNLIPPSAMPFKTGLTYTYDCGEFENNMDMALAAADWEGLAARRAEAAKRGRLRGIGIANAIEISGGPFGGPMEEGAEIRFDSGGTVTLLLGSHNHGQGHETVFRQIACERLGIAPDRIRIVCGDTDLVTHGRGTIGSRSMMAAGGALVTASERILARGRIIAAHLLEASEADIEFDAGQFRIKGTDRSVPIDQVARASYDFRIMPPGEELGLSARVISRQANASFPNGCHVCEVEIDEETGVFELVNYVVVDDVGTVINPLLLKGQIHGGIVQALGQLMAEQIVYDPDNGQLLTVSFMDYGLPRARDLCPIEVLSNPVPTPNNLLGVKGAGEAGTVGGLAAVMNAVVDALRPLGVAHLDMPASPERVWAAIQDARRRGPLNTARRVPANVRNA
jgi:carbon-monoxide dehydrogenase large subunit